MRTPSPETADSKLATCCPSGARIVRCLLVLTLLLQGVLIGVLHYYKDIPIPNVLLEQVNRQLAEQGVHITTQSVKMDLSGELLIEDLELHHEDFQQPLITAPLTIADFSVLRLIIGQLSIERIRIADATVLCPGLYSPTGVSEKAVERLFLDVTATPQGWTVRNLQLKTGSLHASLRGAVPRRLLSAYVHADTLPARADPASQVHGWLRHLKSLIRLRQQFEYFKDPTLRVELRTPTRSSLQAQMRIHSLAVNHPTGVYTGPIFGNLVFSYTDHWTLQGERSYLVTDTLRWQDALTTATCYVQFPPRPIRPQLNQHLLADLQARAYAVVIRGLQLDTVQAQLLDYSDTRIKLAASAVKQREYVQLQATLHPNTQAGTIDFDAYWTPKTLLEFEGIEPNPIFERFALADTPRIRGSLALKPGFTFGRLDFDVHGSGVAYRDLKLNYMHAQGSYADHILSIEESRLVTDRYTVTGSYRHNLRTQDYRFLLAGQVDPTDLNAIIKEDWWLNLWPMFTFHSELPYCNIDLQGRYFGGAAYRRIFAFNRLQDTSFRGTHLRTIEGYLLGQPQAIRLHQLRAEGYQGGQTDLDIEWDYRNGPQRKYSTLFKGTSSLPLDEAARMIGQETMDFVADFALNALPNIQACGIIYGQNSDRAGEEYLHIQGQVEHPIRYHNVTFDFLKFSAFKNAHYVRLRDLRAGLGQGTVTGRLDAFLADDPQNMHLVADLQRAEYGPLKAAIPDIFGPANTETPAAQPEPPPTHIDLSFSAQGPLEDIWKFSGEGRIRVYDTDFGRLHLMGAFSRYLYGLAKLNFGSLNFNYAESTFAFANGKFTFPDIRITGPTGRLEASGQLQLPEEQLNFDILLAPFGEIRTPVISQLLYVFNPLANTLEADLTGTIENPIYDIDFKPLKALTGNTTRTSSSDTN